MLKFARRYISRNGIVLGVIEQLKSRDNRHFVISLLITAGWIYRSVMRSSRPHGVASTPTKNRGLTAMFDQPCQRGHLPLNPETLTIGNKTVTISGDPSKQPNDNIKTKLKNNSTTTTQEACGRASTTSQVLKGINQLL